MALKLRRDEIHAVFGDGTDCPKCNHLKFFHDYGEDWCCAVCDCCYGGEMLPRNPKKRREALAVQAEKARIAKAAQAKADREHRKLMKAEARERCELKAAILNAKQGGFIGPSSDRTSPA